MTTCIFKILLCAWDMNYIKLFYWESLPIPVYLCIWTPGLALFEEIQEYDLLGGSMSLRLPSESLKPWANSSSFFLLCACREKRWFLNILLQPLCLLLADSRSAMTDVTSKTIAQINHSTNCPGHGAVPQHQKKNYHNDLFNKHNQLSFNFLKIRPVL